MIRPIVVLILLFGGGGGYYGRGGSWRVSHYGGGLLGPVLIILLVLWLGGTMGPGNVTLSASPFDAMALPALRLPIDDRVALTVCSRVTPSGDAGAAFNRGRRPRFGRDAFLRGDSPARRAVTS